MPNWCSNRMYFSGEPAQIAEIKRLASGAVTPLYRRATNEGIQLFLAGSAGLLQITENIRSEQCPGVTAAGRGAVSLENIAFTRWLTHLQNGVLLDEQNCLMLHELWLQSGTGQRRWEGLPDDVRETITVHFTAKRGDWCDIWGNEDVSVWWNRLCDNVLPEKTMPFDLLTVLPTRLDIEVNGFNGGVLNGVPSAYHWYTERYGVKWPCGYDLNISSQGENFIQVDFDTPWCQPESDVVAELSRRFGCTLEHWYAEQGCNFCGWQLYERGELVDVLWGELEWSSPTDDDELPEVILDALAEDRITTEHCQALALENDTARQVQVFEAACQSGWGGKQQENLSRQLREKPDHQLKAWAEKQVLENPLQRSDNHFLDELVRKQQASQDGKPRQGALYFVSFSIPEEGLKRMLGETRHYGIPATLRGMVNNDLKTTAEAVLSLVKDGATDGVQIDPTLFSQYGIRSVPALVVFCSQGYDIIRGNLRVGQALEKVAATGDCRQVARALLNNPGDKQK